MLLAICHINADAFAISVARTRDPKLRGRPVIAGNSTNTRGIVTCASYEARQLGIRVGMPLARARRRSRHVIQIAEDPQHCRQVSGQMYDLLQRSAPVVELAGRDEFYLDLTGCERLFGGDLHRWTIYIARRIERELGIPVSMGLATNKLIARLAARSAKPRGNLRVIPGCEKDFIEGMPVDLLPGIDFAQSRRLKSFGILYVRDLHWLPDEAFFLLFGREEKRIQQAMRGMCHQRVRARGLTPRISLEHLLLEETTRLPMLEALVSRLAQQLAWQMRRQGALVRHATLELVYSDEVFVTKSLQMGGATDEEEPLAEAARIALRTLFTRRVRVRRVLLHGSYLPAQEGQPDFLRDQERRSKSHLHQAVERVRSRHGFAKLLSVSSLRPRGGK